MKQSAAEYFLGDLDLNAERQMIENYQNANAVSDYYPKGGKRVLDVMDRDVGPLRASVLARVLALPIKGT